MTNQHLCRNVAFAIAAFALPLVSAAASAEPVELAVQGRLSALAGGPASDGTYALAVALFDAPTGGNQLFKESFLSVATQGGVFALALGATDVKLDSAVFGGAKPVFVGVTVGGDPELARQPLRRVPLAVHAVSAGTAADLQCTGCVASDDLAKGAVTGEKIANGAVGANHVSFNWAAADSPGGAASFALAANNAKSADNAKNADAASFADDANTAKSAAKAALASDLQCTGCVGIGDVATTLPADWVAAGKLAKVATSGAYADLVGGPDLSPYAKLGDANTWLKTQTLGADTDFDKHVALNFRFQVEVADPVACDAKVVGLTYFNSKSSTLLFCDGKTYKPLAVLGDLGTVNNPAKSCYDILVAAPASKSGAYWLKSTAGGAFQAYCNMVDYGGGWTLVLKAGLGMNIASVDRTGSYDPAPTDAAKPPDNTLYKLSDVAINALRTQTTGAVGYWVVTPGSGAAIGPYSGAEIFHRADCTFKMNQNQTQVKSSTCHNWTTTYSATPTWNPGFHWNANDTGGYGWPFGYNNSGVCNQDGRDLGAHEGSLAPFHRGWCGSQAWGLVYAR